MPDEDAIFNLDSLTNKRVAGNLAVGTNARPFLNLDKRPDLRAIPYVAAIEIYEVVDLHILAELHVGRDSLKAHRWVSDYGIMLRTDNSLAENG